MKPLIFKTKTLILKTPEDIELAMELISPPGDTLLRTINHKDISPTELARIMEKTVEEINKIIQGEVEITGETANQLEGAVQIPAWFWMEREKNYRGELAEIEEAKIHLKGDEMKVSQGRFLSEGGLLSI